MIWLHDIKKKEILLLETLIHHNKQLQIKLDKTEPIEKRLEDKQVRMHREVVLENMLQMLQVLLIQIHLIQEAEKKTVVLLMVLIEEYLSFMED